MEFTSDWHSPHIPLWQEHLGPLNGRPVRCLEIGSHEGRSAVWIVQHLLSHPDSTLTCIDPWPSVEAERRFDANVSELGRANQVRKLKTESWRALPLLTPGFEFAYIDGHHEGRHVLEDAIHAFRLVRVGGLVIFDDYRNRPLAVAHPPQPAIDAFLLLWSDSLDVLHQDEQVVIRKVREPQSAPHTYAG
jgi:predicted O-methyltransferase YrrM